MRTIGSILIATMLISGLAVVAGQEKSRITVRRPISSRTSNKLSQLKQRIGRRKARPKLLHFDDLFRSSNVAEPKTRPGTVSQASHTSETTTVGDADQIDDVIDFASPFEDVAEVESEPGWKPDSLSIQPTQPRAQRISVREAKPIRSSARYRVTTGLPQASGQADRFRRGFRPAAENQIRSVKSRSPIREEHQWSGTATAPTFPARQRDASTVGESSISSIELIVPAPIAAAEAEPTLIVPSYRRKSRPVSMTRTIDAVEVAPRTTTEQPHEPHPQVSAPETMTRLQREAAILSRGNLTGFKGFCPVELRDRRVLTNSQPGVFVNYGHRTYYFSTTAAREKFTRDPARYTPAANGDEVVSLLNESQTAQGRLDHAVWFHNKLYLFASARNLALFNANPARYANP